VADIRRNQQGEPAAISEGQQEGTTMALFEDILEGGMLEGSMGPVLAVAGVVVLAPTLLPVVGRLMRPVAKAAIKGGLVLYEGAVSTVGEAIGDLVAEARAELEAGEGGSESGARRTRRAGRTEGATA
jgi:Protein of unknown function (DUF5132)